MINDRKEAIELSKNSVKTGGGPFGAVIAKDGFAVRTYHIFNASHQPVVFPYI